MRGDYTPRKEGLFRDKIDPRVFPKETAGNQKQYNRDRLRKEKQNEESKVSV
jgi:hypothetical protein